MEKGLTLFYGVLLLISRVNHLRFRSRIQWSRLTLLPFRYSFLLSLLFTLLKISFTHSSGAGLRCSLLGYEPKYDEA